jgi:Sap-like sulfolipid-1-addressing protein
MNAEFFTLAFTAAANPSLLAVDLVLMVNRRPRAMPWCVLLGGVGIAVLAGLVDVLVIRSDVVKTQGSLSPGADLALGLLLLAAGVLLLTGRFRRQREPGPAPEGGAKEKSSWMERALREPRLGLAVLIGAVLGLPGVGSTSPRCII